MQLATEHKVQVGDDGIFTFAEPTPKQWEEFNNRKFPVSGRGRKVRLQQNLGAARVWLFDQLITNIEHINDGETEITIETKEKIPARMKESAIFEAFEAELDDIAKNS